MTMFPVAVHAGAVCSFGVEDAEDDASGVRLGPDDLNGPPLDVAVGEAEVQPLATSSKAAPTSAAANRWEVLPRCITEQAYMRGLRPDSGRAT